MSIAPFGLIADVDTREQSAKTPTIERETKPPGDRGLRAGRLLLRLLGSGYRDALFERPDVVENDYCRFLNQPRSW